VSKKRRRERERERERERREETNDAEFFDIFDL
jgi:hypothetical protein